jgi:hypothetical protein
LALVVVVGVVGGVLVAKSRREAAEQEKRAKEKSQIDDLVRDNRAEAEKTLNKIAARAQRSPPSVTGAFAHTPQPLRQLRPSSVGAGAEGNTVILTYAQAAKLGRPFTAPSGPDCGPREPFPSRYGKFTSVRDALDGDHMTRVGESLVDIDAPILEADLARLRGVRYAILVHCTSYTEARVYDAEKLIGGDYRAELYLVDLDGVSYGGVRVEASSSDSVGYTIRSQKGHVSTDNASDSAREDFERNVREALEKALEGVVSNVQIDTWGSRY